MKLVRAGELGHEKPGVIDDTGVIRDLSALIPDWDYRSLVPSVIEQVRSLDLSTLPALDADIRLGAPVFRPGKIVGCALTYGNALSNCGSATTLGRLHACVSVCVCVAIFARRALWAMAGYACHGRTTDRRCSVQQF